VIDASITRAVRITSPADSARGANTVSVEMDAAGDETQMILTLEFEPNSLSIDPASFPNANTSVTLGPDAPEGTSIAVNATETGRITILLNFNGPVPSGLGKRMVDVAFQENANRKASRAPETLSAVQVVDSSGSDLRVAYHTRIDR
jgi:hypothetical protein